uniref:F-box domain-containing protein n=1 Tax=Nymphaea colorata TaxID=210225 RepID=A0A5K0VJ36_9MAGN
MEVAEDRLSALPDPLIQLILSFLPTNESARTSALARRWLHLWTFIPNLHLELRRCRDIHKAGRFAMVVDRCLLFRLPPLRILR